MTLQATAYCPGEHYLPVPEIGYWVDRRDIGLAGNVYPCVSTSGDDRDPRCGVLGKQAPGSHWRDLTSAKKACWQREALLNATLAEACEADGLAECVENSGGLFCVECVNDEKPVYSSSAGGCVECGSSSATALIVFGAVAVPALVFACSPAAFKVLLKGVPFLKYLDTSKLKIVWSTLQIVASVSVSLEMEFPEPFKTMLGIYQFTQLNFLRLFSLECYGLSSYHTLALMTSALPLLVCALIWIAYFVRKALGGDTPTRVEPEQAGGGDPAASAASEASPPKRAAEATPGLFSQHMGWFLVVCYVCLPAVAMTQFRGLNCGELENDDGTLVEGTDTIRYLRVDRTIDCDGAEHEGFVGQNLILIILYQLLPISWLVLLYQKVRSGDLNPDVAIDGALRKRDSDPDLAHLRFLFVEYTADRWFWDVFDIYRRIVFISILPFLGKGAGRAGIGCLIALISVIVYREGCPYQEGSTNVLATTAQYQILATFLGALVIEMAKLGGTFTIDNFMLGVILCAANVLVVGLAGAMGWNKYKHDLKHMEKKVMLTESKMKIVQGVMTDRRFESTNVVLKELLLDADYLTKGKLIGSGSFGDVFKGEYMNEPCAIKTIKKISQVGTLILL